MRLNDVFDSMLLTSRNIGDERPTINSEKMWNEKQIVMMHFMLEECEKTFLNYFDRFEINMEVLMAVVVMKFKSKY